MSATKTQHISSVGRYRRYLDKYREYQRFDTGIEEVSISRCHDTAKYREMKIPVTIQWSLSYSNVDMRKRSHSSQGLQQVFVKYFVFAHECSVKTVHL